MDGRSAKPKPKSLRREAIESAIRGEMLGSILSYPRGKGQTYAMMEGAIRSNAIVLAINLDQAKRLAGPRGRSIQLLESVYGIRDPVLIDHAAMAIELFALSNMIRDLVLALPED